MKASFQTVTLGEFEPRAKIKHTSFSDSNISTIIKMEAETESPDEPHQGMAACKEVEGEEEKTSQRERENQRRAQTRKTHSQTSKSTSLTSRMKMRSGWKGKAAEVGREKNLTHIKAKRNLTANLIKERERKAVSWMPCCLPL